MRAVLVIVLVVGLALAALWLGQRRLIYFPDRADVPAAPDLLSDARDVELHTSDGLRLRAWLVAPARPARGMAILLAPGNAGNRLDRAALAREFAGLGLTVLLMDYRGYGGNPGTPTQAGLSRDVRAGRQYLIETAGVPADRIVYFGESLGAAVVTELATAHRPAGLILRSPFADLAAVGGHHYPLLPVRALLRDRWPVTDLIGAVASPTVVIYGTADSIVPPEQSQAVAERAGGPVRLIAVDGADHNDPALVQGPKVIGAVRDLVTGVAG
ncbi:MAG TPA: alpha/beta fold hydrolase [Micromonosporaceae bacterium]|nr:alpha/beta fold hydrolase [Micromonosporaceae bacterium]